MRYGREFLPSGNQLFTWLTTSELYQPKQLSSIQHLLGLLGLLAKVR